MDGKAFSKTNSHFYKNLAQRPWLMILAVVCGSVALYTVIHLYLDLPYHISTGIMISTLIPLIVGAPTILLQSRLAQKLEQQRHSLESLNEQKGLLLSLLAHDMRGPLAALRQTLDYIDEEGSPEDALELLPYINKSVTDTIELLDNLLQWTRVQFDNDVQTEMVDIHDNFTKVIQQYSSRIADKKITIELNTDRGQQVTINKEIINLILGNLLSNAIKYTPAEGRIRILFEQYVGQIQICVEDTGIGMSSAQIATLFSPQPVVSVPGTAKETGHGIGLMICSQLIKKLGGQIWAESEPEQGSRFFLRIDMQ